MSFDADVLSMLQMGKHATGQRSRRGCLTCRRRRVKCDEIRPSCGKCSLKFRQCIWAEGSSSQLSRKRHASDRPVEVDILGRTPGTDIIQDITPRPPTISDPDINPFSDSWLGYTTLSASALGKAATSPIRHARFYIPPDVLPNMGMIDHYRAILSTQPTINSINPGRKAEMMADPSFLKPYFPSIDDRLIMRHFLLKTTKNLVAFGCQRRPWDPWIDFVVPLACNDLPGHSLASDALRAAILAIGTVHLRFCDDSSDQQGAWDIVRTAKSKVLLLVKRSIDGQDATGSPLEKSDIEMILASLLCCAVASSLAADSSWQELLNTITAVVDRLGGAQALLKEGSQEKLSSFRFFLEQLAVRDVFGCMTTQMAPQLLNTAFSPWFFEAEQWSNGDHEWESVERMFGISRGMVDFMARSCTLIHKVRKDCMPSFSENEFPLQLPAHAIARLPSQSLPITGTATRNALLAEANDLLAELTVWYQACGYSPYHPRVQYGNHSYRHTIRIRLLREVYAVPMDDTSVQESVKAIMELATEMVCACGRITWLTWPILTAGFNMLQGDPNRNLALKLLGEFGRFACFDNTAACRMLNERWEAEIGIKALSPVSRSKTSLVGKPFFD